MTSLPSTPIRSEDVNSLLDMFVDVVPVLKVLAIVGYIEKCNKEQKAKMMLDK